MIRPVVLFGLALLAGCGGPVSYYEIGGREIMVGSVEEKRDLQGRRVVDMVAIQGAPLFASYSPEMEERMVAAGVQEARKVCGGEAEFVRATRWVHQARNADLRFRCF